MTTLLILGLIVTMAAGCAASVAPTNRSAATNFSQSSVRNTQPPRPMAAAAIDRDDASLSREAEAELGAEAAEDLPEVQREPLEPRDPGADAVTEQMLAAMGEIKRDEHGKSRVCISKVRNLSRASSEEFEDFLERFAELLSLSAADANVEFEAEALESDPAQYDMLGTAYLVTAEGFDLWELFITLTPAGRGWTIWQPAGPVRVLRQPRPGQQQIFPAR